MATSDMAEALAALEKARASAAQEAAVANAKLKQIDEALQMLRRSLTPEAPSREQDFIGLGLVEGTRRLLIEHGKPMQTGDIARELKARGVSSRSKNFIANLYSTLFNSDKIFERIDGCWALVAERKGRR
jgi:hypothetical protein